MNHRNLLSEGMIDDLINRFLPGAQTRAEKAYLKKNAKKIKKYEQEMDRLEDEINTKLDKLWDDLIKRTGHDPGVFPTYHYSGKKRK